MSPACRILAKSLWKRTEQLHRRPSQIIQNLRTERVETLMRERSFTYSTSTRQSTRSNTQKPCIWVTLVRLRISSTKTEILGRSGSLFFTWRRKCGSLTCLTRTSKLTSFASRATTWSTSNKESALWIMEMERLYLWVTIDSWLMSVKLLCLNKLSLHMTSTRVSTLSRCSISEIKLTLFWLSILLTMSSTLLRESSQFKNCSKVSQKKTIPWCSLPKKFKHCHL